ncbi:enoyl-CoA hydratase-related protein [Gordonia polyisoprenivorans]|uniref:Enoyl-CoA hydratase n=1 Tax=Gordonia polyisoprenivorans TaxID=84595 RepID=A0A846WKS7_9ACTN|nr:enoyl-CoA hydratase-related protein [Gordonia polyisoprenivorans]NKY01433.1 enoyl-CoA hydratase [Gordonia polyisoprenivorans]
MTDWEKIRSSQVIEVHRRGSATRVTLARPQALNAFDTLLQSELRNTLDELTADDSVRCVVLTGAGRAFSSGADLTLDDLGPQTRLAPRTEEELRMRYNPTIRAIRTMPKPVIAAVNGTAAGVGCALALACDHVVAVRSASFVLAFSRVGLTLDAGTSALLGARVGFGRATRMAMLAEPVDADTALSWGMIDAVVADDALAARVDEVAEHFATGPTRSYAATKRSLNAALLPHLDEAFEAEIAGQTELVDSTDFRTGVDAFMNRRTPQFIGR